MKRQHIICLLLVMLPQLLRSGLHRLLFSRSLTECPFTSPQLSLLLMGLCGVAHLLHSSTFELLLLCL